MKLNLGCGESWEAGFLNCDRVFTLPARGTGNPENSTFREIDLQKLPWDFENNSVEEIQAHAIIEHIPQHLKMSLIEELWRICKNGARICITTCSFDHPNQWQDPTHTSAWHIDNFNYFTKGHPFGYYSRARFKILQKELRRETEGNQLYWLLEVEKGADDEANS